MYCFLSRAEITYDNVLKVLGAVDTEVFESMLKCILASDAAGCMQLIENIIMKGKEITQFISDFVWYLRNMLLVKQQMTYLLCKKLLICHKNI